LRVIIVYRGIRMQHESTNATTDRSIFEQPSVRVAVADDHPLFCRVIMETLEKHLGWSVIGCSATGEETLEVVRHEQPDLLILDLQLAGPMDGYAVIREIRDKQLPVKVFVLTAHCDRESFIHEINTPNGPDGILEKDTDTHELIYGLTEVMSGRKFRPSRLMENHSNHDSESGPLAVLTARELVVLEMVAHGYAYKKIAQELHVHEQTVRNHMQSIYEKLNLEVRAPQAAAAAYFKYR